MAQRRRVSRGELAAIAVAGAAVLGGALLIGEQKQQSAPERLPAPGGLFASNVTADGFYASWHEVNGADGYVLEVDGTTMDTTAACAQVGGLEPTTDYRVRVAARKGGVTGNWSAAITVPTGF